MQRLGFVLLMCLLLVACGGARKILRTRVDLQGNQIASTPTNLTVSPRLASPTFSPQPPNPTTVPRVPSILRPTSATIETHKTIIQSSSSSFSMGLPFERNSPPDGIVPMGETINHSNH